MPGVGPLPEFVVADDSGLEVDALEQLVDARALRVLAREVRPKLITLGGSLNLWPHPVAAVRGIADEVGAPLMFDAAPLFEAPAGPAEPLSAGPPPRGPS